MEIVNEVMTLLMEKGDNKLIKELIYSTTYKTTHKHIF